MDQTLFRVIFKLPDYKNRIFLNKIAHAGWFNKDFVAESILINLKSLRPLDLGCFSFFNFQVYQSSFSHPQGFRWVRGKIFLFDTMPLIFLSVFPFEREKSLKKVVEYWFLQRYGFYRSLTFETRYFDEKKVAQERKKQKV